MNELLGNITSPDLLNDGTEGPGDGAKPNPKVVPVKPLPNQKVPIHPAPKPYDLDAEMEGKYKNIMRFDNKPVLDIIRSAASKVPGANPVLLGASAVQEGMNLAILKPNDVSAAYNNAEAKGLDTRTYPVDGFYNYGLDTFGDQYQNVKRYLPPGFESRFKVYKAMNDHKKIVNGKRVPDPQPITTAAFKTNEDALIAKAAMMKMASDNISTMAKKKGIELDQDALDYLTFARFNATTKSFNTIFDEYAKAKDKKSFIAKGETTQKEVHTNISPRMNRRKIIQQLLDTP